MTPEEEQAEREAHARSVLASRSEAPETLALAEDALRAELIRLRSSRPRGNAQRIARIADALAVRGANRLLAMSTARLR